MNGFKAYRYYLALKLHFTKEKFNVFENRGNIKGSYETFQARNDRFMFDKLARKYDTDQELIQYYVANFAYGNDNMVYDMEQSEENYITWKRRKESITRTFKNDLDTLQYEVEKNNLDKINTFYFVNTNFPWLVKMYLGKRITIETIHIIDKLGYNIIDNWSAPEAMLIDVDVLRIEKLDGFVKFDKDKCQKIFQNFLHSLMWDV